MGFAEKLKELREEKGITEEQLAERIFVKSEQVKKWESGNGYPSIDTVREIALYFSAPIDELLTKDELISVAEHDKKIRGRHLCDIFFGALDISASLLLFLPVFAQRNGTKTEYTSLIVHNDIPTNLKVAFLAIIIGTILLGAAVLALHSREIPTWNSVKIKLSFAFSLIAVFSFIIAAHPYAAILAFVLTVFKVFAVLEQ